MSPKWSSICPPGSASPLTVVRANGILAFVKHSSGNRPLRTRLAWAPVSTKARMVRSSPLACALTSMRSWVPPPRCSTRPTLNGRCGVTCHGRTWTSRMFVYLLFFSRCPLYLDFFVTYCHSPLVFGFLMPPSSSLPSFPFVKPQRYLISRAGIRRISSFGGLRLPWLPMAVKCLFLPV